MEEKDIFKTETIYDEMVHRECVRYAPLAHRGRIWTEIILEVSLLLVLLQFGNENAIYAFMGWSVVFLGVFHLVTQKRIKRDYPKILQSNNGEPMHNRIHLRADGIHLVNPRSGNEMFYAYSQILRIVETPKLILLLTADKKWIILQKCWLQGGTPAELAAFLREHCPRVPRIHGIRFGQWVHRIYVSTMIAGTLLGLALLFGAPIVPEESKSFTELATELSSLGITISQETVAEVEAFYAEYPQLSPEEGPSNADKARDLLFMEGMGDFDGETFEWTPSDSGVYWMDVEVFYVDSIYTDFFAGLSAMDEELDFANVQEDYSKVDIDSGTGTLPVSFDFHGQHYELNARYNYDWFDDAVLSEVIRIVNSADGEKQLYYAFDGGQGFLFYYGTTEDVRALKQLTDLRFTASFRIPQLYF